MHDLGTFGGPSSYAYGINSSGQVVGWADGNGGIYGGYPTYAFLYSGGMMQNLGTLGGADSYAYGINDSGQVVGVAWNSNQYEHAFLYSGGTMYDVNSLIPTTSGWTVDAADAINAEGPSHNHQDSAFCEACQKDNLSCHREHRVHRGAKSGTGLSRWPLCPLWQLYSSLKLM